MSEKILNPCPECGSTNIGMYCHFDGEVDDWIHWYSVACDDCGYTTKEFRSQSEAVQAWPEMTPPHV